MNSLAFVRDINEVEPTAVLEFFSIQYDQYNPDAIFYFHGGANEDIGIINDVIWQGKSYKAIALESNDFELVANQKMPRPRIKFANIEFYISQILKAYNRLLNAKVTRQKVFVKYIDSINFSGGINPYSVPDTNAGFITEVFYVNRVSSESRFAVEFELTTSLELENIRIPKRQIIARYCSFIYRGAGCLYSGVPCKNGRDEAFTDTSGNAVTLGLDKGEWSEGVSYTKGQYVFRFSRAIRERGVDPSDITFVKVYFICRDNHTSSYSSDPFKRTDLWERDDCSRRLSGCKFRFNPTNLPTSPPLSFGGFLGTAGYGS